VTPAELDELLSRPSESVLAALGRAPGDIVILGAGGKMGPSLSRMARRAADALGDGRRVIAVSRWSDERAAAELRAHGVETFRCDLLDWGEVARLPDAPNVIFMAGQKFGTRDAPAMTWAMNVLVPAIAAERYASSRIVAFSTGNVYPLVPVALGGAREDHALAPVGEYAMSCVGRERMFEHAAARHGTRSVLVRLNYAIALRYGVLTDLALRVAREEPVDLAMGYVNVIWQGDANARALAALPLASAPPLVLNVTGPETLSVRALASRFGELLGRRPVLRGGEAPDALLSSSAASDAIFGPPAVRVERMLEWTADWIRAGGELLGKPTSYERRTGDF
jgi:hypothetical protein